jgi:hypothetical protein
MVNKVLLSPKQDNFLLNVFIDVDVLLVIIGESLRKTNLLVFTEKLRAMKSNISH